MVDDVEGRLGDSPGHPLLLPVLDVPAHGPPARLVEQRPRIALHHQQGHEVLEETGAPRQQGGGAVHAREQAPEVEPVAVGDVTLGDGDEAGQPGFRCEQVVEIRIEPPCSLGVGEAIPDHENLAQPVVQEVEAHVVDERQGALRQRFETRREPGRIHDRCGHCGGQRPRPVDRLGLVGGGDRLSLELRDRTQQSRAQRRGADQLLRRIVGMLHGGQDGRHRGVQTRPAGAGCGRGVRELFQALQGERRGIGEAVRDRAGCLRLASQPSQAFRQGQERPCQVSTVHGRDVARCERRQRPRVVPVEQVTFEALETFYC